MLIHGLSLAMNRFGGDLSAVSGGGGGYDLTTNLVAHWKFEEGSGNRVDEIGPYTLTDVNTVTTIAGVVGSVAANFTRANAERLYMTSVGALQMGDIDFCISCWVRPTGTVTNVQGIWNKWYDNSEREYCLYLSVFSANKLSFIVRNAANTADTWITGVTSLSANTWYHVVCCHDSVNNKLQMYVNGVLDGLMLYSGGVYDGAVNPRDFAVGCDQDPPVSANNSYFNGAIDDLRVYKNRMLTGDEIGALYALGNP